MKFNQIKVGAILSYFSMVLGYIISIVYTPFMLKLLGQSEFGLYSLVSSIVGYLGLLNFGFTSTYMRYYTRYKVQNDKENIARLNGMFLVVFCIIGFIALLAGSVLTTNIQYILGDKLSIIEMTKAKTLMAILVTSIAISFPFTLFQGYIISNEKYIFQNLINLLRTILNPFLLLLVLLMGYKSIGLVYVASLMTITFGIVNMIFCFSRLKIKFNFLNFNINLMREMSVFSSFLFLNMIIDQINWSTDKFIIGRYRGTIEVAIYGLAAQINSYYLSISMTIITIFIPRVNRMVAEGSSSVVLTEFFTKIGRIQFILLSLVCTGLIFFGKPFIELWVGSDYRDSYLIMLVLVIPVTIPMIQVIGAEIQKAKFMHRFMTLVYFFVAIINIIISIPLTKIYGGFGAALGTAIALIIGQGFIMNWNYSRRIGLDIKFFWHEILSFIPALISPIIIGVLINLIANLYSFVYFISFVVIYTVVFCLSMWLVGMNKYEKDLFRGPVMQLLSKFRNKYS